MTSFDKTEPSDEHKKAAEALNLQESFLDSILPGPPSISTSSHDASWTGDFSAASEQWEHFSPLTWDAKYTSWGSSRRAPAKSSVRTSGYSPGSVAEI